MNLLVIGGCHTYGYGLSDNQCFVDQFTKQLEQWGCPVSVATYPLIELHQAMVLLSELPLNQYDLIILQLGHYWLQHPAGFQSLLIPLKKPSARLTRPGTPMMADELVRLRQAPVVLSGNEHPSVGKCLKTTLKLGLLYGLSATRKLTRLNEVNNRLRALLTLLQRHRQRTVLLTPFPHLEPVSRFLRQQGRQLFLQKGRLYGFPVFDTDQVIRPDQAYFLTNDHGHLNATGHELLGRSLSLFYKTHFITESDQAGGNHDNNSTGRLLMRIKG